MTAAPLIDMWLHPDQSDDRWHQIKDSYQDRQWSDAKRKFMDYCRGFRGSVKYESTFSGLEHRLYYWFFNGRLNRKDYKMPEPEYQEAVKGLYRGMMQRFDWLFDEANPSPYDVRFCRLQEWRDAFLMAYHDCEELEWTIEWIEKILNDRENKHPVHVEFAEKVNEILNDPELPEAAKLRIVELREQYSNE
jgi:hypothetical protein